MSEVRGVREATHEELKEFYRERVLENMELKERVKELEDIIYKDERQAVLESMYEQNKRYREALEEIVYQENLKETNVLGYDHEDISSYVEEVARKALEGEE